jgi:DNA-directed RNA polymerase specialized sigma24 family protein
MGTPSSPPLAAPDLEARPLPPCAPEAPPEVFAAFLDRLDPDRDEALDSYFRLREKLIRFFGWRGHHLPEDLADEALNRAATRVHAGATVESAAVPAFVLGIARRLFLEEMRRWEAERKALGQLRAQSPSSSEPAPENPLLMVLLRCLDQLPPAHRSLILRYYECDGGDRIRTRRELARELEVGRRTLRIRAHRIRRQLEVCARKLLAQGTSRSGNGPSKLVET